MKQQETCGCPSYRGSVKNHSGCPIRGGFIATGGLRRRQPQSTVAPSTRQAGDKVIRVPHSSRLHRDAWVPPEATESAGGDSA